MIQPDDEECEALAAGATVVVPTDGIRSKVMLARRERRPLIIKLGFDPTAPDLHLGHAVVLKKLRQFQSFGHKIVVILGEFTARIGDPTGKNKARPPLTHAQVTENASTYLEQLGLVLDVGRAEVRSNAAWLDSMTLRDAVDLLARNTLAQIMQRDDFSQRFQKGAPISLHELMYPILQGYDSYEIRADIEIGGMEQLLNCLVGRHMQESKGQVPQAVLCMPLLRGLDGEVKMSKSEGNYVGLKDGPNEMYGKLMSIPDTLLAEYIDLTTELPPSERDVLKARLREGLENPMLIKKVVAFDVVRQYHGSAEAELAADTFYRQVQKKERTDGDYERVRLDAIPPGLVRLVDVCAHIASKSKSEVRRLIQAGAVRVNGERVGDVHFTFDGLKVGTTIKFGKLRHYELVDA